MTPADLRREWHSRPIDGGNLLPSSHYTIAASELVKADPHLARFFVHDMRNSVLPAIGAMERRADLDPADAMIYRALLRQQELVNAIAVFLEIT